MSKSWDNNDARWTFSSPSRPQPSSNSSTPSLWPETSEIAQAIVMAAVTVTAAALCDAAWRSYTRRPPRSPSSQWFGQAMTSTTGQAYPLVVVGRGSSERTFGGRETTATPAQADPVVGRETAATPAGADPVVSRETTAPPVQAHPVVGREIPALPVQAKPVVLGHSLLTYGRDMTATAGQADPVVGRDDEIDRVLRILCRRTKNCAALVGDPGVGKTAIAEGLAQRVAAGTVPASLVGARVVELDVAGMIAGTVWRGMFEERMKNVIKDVEDTNGQVILFIDEMHILIGAGDWQGCHDAANMLKPALARGRIRCVGATTLDEYRKKIEKDPALERRFQKVHVDEPSEKSTIAILHTLKKGLQQHHGMEIHDDAIVAAVQLAGRYVTGRQFPDKAIDLIDEACATTKGGQTFVSPDHVAEVVSRWTGIPVAALDPEETEKLIHLADRLHERVVGQNEAINSVVQAVLRSRAGLDPPGQPIGSFLFLGSTGVGKTELAKALAEQLFDDEKALLRFDMSEYVSEGSVMRLVGAPPSYHGYNDGGQLTNNVRSRPYSVILFDEVEKADSSVHNVFLQLLDDGILTDGKGQKVDFKNTIVIMTSNIGAEHLIAATRGECTMKDAQDLLMKKVQRYFKPELINRLSQIAIFEPLSLDQLMEVVKIQMRSATARVAKKGISLSTSDAALDFILSKSYDPMYGARPIRRWVQNNLMTVISEMLIKKEASKDSTIRIDVTDDKKGLTYDVVKTR